jgi:hypothetical protein
MVIGDGTNWKYMYDPSSNKHSMFERNHYMDILFWLKSTTRNAALAEMTWLGCPFIRHIFFIRIMNIFDLLFEYSNNIRIFILLNKLPILAQNSQKNPKNPKKIQIG